MKGFLKHGLHKVSIWAYVRTRRLNTNRVNKVLAEMPILTRANKWNAELFYDTILEKQFPVRTRSVAYSLLLTKSCNTANKDLVR